MPCLLGCIALSAPRFVLFLVWLFSNYLDQAYATNFWPFLGFLFLPLTTLGYAFAVNHFGGAELTGVGWAIVLTALVVDLGLFGTSRRRKGQGPKKNEREIVVKGEKVG
ncbi:MAG: hypothetical protein ACKVWV_05625 [Planctomycetota bacterium]